MLLLMVTFLMFFNNYIVRLCSFIYSTDYCVLQIADYALCCNADECLMFHS